jgi:hypothetical protein
LEQEEEACFRKPGRYDFFHDHRKLVDEDPYVVVLLVEKDSIVRIVERGRRIVGISGTVAVVIVRQGLAVELATLQFVVAERMIQLDSRQQMILRRVTH